jgi:putative transcriptional regulator
MVAIMEQTDFGRRLRALRKAIGLTQAELAEASGVHRQIIARLETGVGQPTWTTAVALARALDCTPNDFLLEDEPAAKPKRKKK